MLVTFEPIFIQLAKRKLKIEPEFDFILIGIVTPLQDYRLAWFINNLLHKSLAKNDDYLLNDALNKKQMTFSKFDFFEELTMSVFHLLQNKHANDCLLPEAKEVDYILIIKGDYYKTRKNQIIKKIKSLEEIQTAVIWEADKMKSRNNLVME